MLRLRGGFDEILRPQTRPERKRRASLRMTMNTGLGLARRLLELGQIRENFGAVFFGVDVEIGFADDAIGIDEKGMARGKFCDA